MKKIIIVTITILTLLSSCAFDGQNAYLNDYAAINLTNDLLQKQNEVLLRMENRITLLESKNDSIIKILNELKTK